MSGYFKVESNFIPLIAEIGAAAAVIYLLLLSHCNEDRTCWPSMRRLQELSDFGVNTIRRALDALKIKGLIEVKKRNADNGTCLPNVFYLPPISHPAILDRVPVSVWQGTLPNQIGRPCQIEQGDPAKTEILTIYKKEINRTRRGEAAIPPAELLELIDGWNSLGGLIVKPGNGARRDPPAQAVLSGWHRAMKNSEQQAALQDIPLLIEEIQKATFCHAQGWFSLPWLFGKNKHGEFNICRILAGAYLEESRNGNGHAQAEASKPDDLPILTRRK
jgi:hypothetical protein